MIDVYSNRKVTPEKVIIANQHENLSNILEFNFHDLPNGYLYLILTKYGKSHPYLITDNKVDITSQFTWKSGGFEANIVISDEVINDVLDSTHYLWISNTFVLYVKSNSINADSLQDLPIPPDLKMPYDELIRLIDEVNAKLENGEFNGKDGIGIKSIAKTGSEGLVDTYTITLTDDSTFEYTVTNGYSPSASVTQEQDGALIKITDKSGSTSVKVLNGTNGKDGVDGKSAYEIAVENGFEGTEEEWLQSLDYEHSDEFTQLATQVRTDAEQSTQNAKKAEQSASESSISAEQALQSASNAQSHANSASQSATQASQSAKSANQSATAAKQNEDNALQSKEEALNSANKAKEEADKAQAIADTLDPIKFAVKENAEGNPIIISDSADWENQGLDLYGQSEQESTTGANLFDAKTALKSQIEQGYAKVNDDGSVVLNGTLDSQNRNFYFTLPKGTYYFSGGYDKNNKLVYHTLYPNDSAFEQTVTLEEETTIQGYIDHHYGEYRNLVTYPMINEGSTALPFEPYTGEKPSPSPDYPQEIISKEVSKIKFTGKNLNDGIKHDFSGSTNGQITSSAFGSIVVPIIGGETYTISVSTPQIIFHCTTKEPPEIGVSLIDSYAGSAGLKVSTKKMTTKKEAKYLIININDSDFSILQNAQVEIGSNATSYEPYKEKIVNLTSPITLRGIQVDTDGNITIDGQQYLADRVVEKEGVYGIERNVVDAFKHISTTSIEIDATSNNTNRFRLESTDILKSSTYACICNILPYKIIWIVDNEGIYADYQHVILRINKSTCGEDEQTAKDWLINNINKFHVYACLNNSKFEPLPEADQEAIRKLKTFYPNTVIDTGCFTKIKYVADTELYIEKKINEVVSTVSNIQNVLIGG